MKNSMNYYDITDFEFLIFGFTDLIQQAKQISPIFENYSLIYLNNIEEQMKKTTFAYKSVHHYHQYVIGSSSMFCTAI